MGLTSKNAFAQLIRKRKWYKGLPISQGAALIAIDKMEGLLEMAAVKVIRSKLWVVSAERTVTSVIHDAIYAEVFQKARLQCRIMIFMDGGVCNG
jgi:hypothetical protein